MGFSNRMSMVDPLGLSGGLLLCWDPKVQIMNCICKSFYIAVQFQINSQAPQWGIFVYFNACKSIRYDQWQEFIEDKPSWGNLWFAIGEWNDIRANSEKSGGITRSPLSCQPLNGFINDMEMEEIQLVGYPYTWCNNRADQDLVEEYLDRAFVSPDWFQIFPNASISNLVRSASDHTPLLFDFGLPRERKKSRFHFDKRWIGKEGFEETIQHAWRTKVSGTPFYQLKEKIKHVRTTLLIWSSKFQTQNQALISQLTNKLQMLNQDKSGSQWESWENTRRDLEKAHRQEEMFWQQKARLKWLKEGDSNTRFFHTLTLQRTRFNAITRLLTSRGQAVTNQEDIASHIAEFYKNLFSSEGSWASFLLNLLEQYRLFSGQQVNLQKSAAFFSKNTPLQLQLSICQTLNGITSHRSTRYLGLPLGIGKSKKEVFDYILTSV
ncbi:Unknown protein, partial [Striga hermonthica]